MLYQGKKQGWLFQRCIVFLFVFCIVGLLFAASIWLFGKSLFPSQNTNKTITSPSPATVSPLLFGSTLELDSNQPLDLNSLKSRLQELHIRILHLTIQKGVSLDTAQNVAFLLENLQIAPLVTLRVTFDSTAATDDLALVKLMNSVFKNHPVYYEYGNEEDALGITADAYTTSWNTTIGELTQVATNGRFVGPVTYQYDSQYLQMFLAHAQPQPYAVSWHEFTCSSSSTESQCLTNISQLTNDITRARDIMQTTLEGTFPIMITEWNYAANATPNDGKSNDSTFMTNWTTRALQALINNNVFAAAQYDYSNTISSMPQLSQSISAQDRAFQMFSTKYANTAVTSTTATIPSSTPASSFDGTFVDNLNDWDDTFSHTNNLIFDTATSTAFNNDVSRASRSSSRGHEEIVWRLPGITSFTVVTYFWLYEPISPFSIYTSADGNTWQQAIPEITHDHDQGNWYQYLYVLPSLSNVSYVKVYWNNTQGQIWSPQVGKAILTYDTSRTTIDDLNDWSKTFSHTNNLTFDAPNSSAFGGDTSRAMRNNVKTQEEITWNRTNLTFFEASTYFWRYEAVSRFSFYTSADGSTWQEAKPVITSAPIKSDSTWQHYTYSLSNLSHVNFVKIRWNNTSGQSWSPQISKVVLVS